MRLKKVISQKPVFLFFGAFNFFWVHFVTKVSLHFWNPRKNKNLLIPILVYHCYDTRNATYNQRIIQSTPAIFSFQSWTMDVVITVEKVCEKGVRERQTCIGLIFGG
jgi:hypothetical protein